LRKLEDLPSNRKSIGSKWVFKLKFNETGKVVRYKARLVAQGFTQKYGIDYDEIFAPVARSETLRLLLSVAGKKNYHVYHYDVKTAFLNGHLKEEIYLRQPQGFKINDKVLKLNKSLYGLKQAARVWNQTFHDKLLKIGFVQNETDKCLYVLREQEKLCYLLVHVDDILLVSNDLTLLNFCSEKIGKQFEIKNLGNVKHYLGMDVLRDSEGHFKIAQSSYIDKIVEEAGLSDAKASNYPLDIGYFKISDSKSLVDNNEYRKLVGMLLYLATHSRPDISASVAILSQKISNPNETDLNEIKRIVRYLKGTRDLKLVSKYVICTIEGKCCCSCILVVAMLQNTIRDNLSEFALRSQ
jgi:Reverse transcriptase (RNA-dependent DNA polymerase)